MRLILALAAAAWMVGVTDAAAAPVVWPGACSAVLHQGVRLSWLPADLRAYCTELETGTAAFHRGRYRAALIAYRHAAAVADKLDDPDLRGVALAESRAARALVLEAMGEMGAALALLAEHSPEARGVGALTRGYMLARHGLFEDAAAVLAEAAARLPDFWCAADDRALARLRAGQPPGIDPELNRDVSDWHYLPSYLRPTRVLGCNAAKAALVPFPLPRSFQVNFALNADRWTDTPAHRRVIEAMIAVIRSRKDGGVRFEWTVTGHADQSCPPAPANCRAFNDDLARRRARNLAAQLRRHLPGSVSLGVVSRGMDAPLVDAGTGKPDPRNRRVALSVRTLETLAVRPSCPWTMTVYDPGLPAPAAKQVPAIQLVPDAEAMPFTHEAVYEVRYHPIDPTTTHLYVFREADGGPTETLYAGAVPSTAGPFRLPATAEHRYYRVDAHRAGETVTLHAATGPIAALERRGEGIPVSGRPGVQIANLGTPKAFEPSMVPDFLDQPSHYRPNGQPESDRTEPASDPIIEPAGVGSPPPRNDTGRTATVKACRFRLAIR